MKIRNLLILFVATASLILASCENEVLSPQDDITSSESGLEVFDLTNSGTAAAKKNNGKGNNRGKQEEPPTEEPSNPVNFTSTYAIAVVDEPDFLFRFSFSEEGDLILLESDPNAGPWGTDFYGSWSDPFPFSNNTVIIEGSLSTVTYDLVPLAGNQFDVSRTLVQRDYITRQVIAVTETHLGIFTQVN